MHYVLPGAVFVLAVVLVAGDKDSKEIQPPAPIPDNPKVAIEPRMRPSKEVREDEGKEPSIRVDTTLVLINVTVTDPQNRFVTGLEKEHFTLQESRNFRVKMLPYPSDSYSMRAAAWAAS